MTVIYYGERPWIFLKTKKTAGSSIEAALFRCIDPRTGEISTSRDPEPLDWPIWATPNQTTERWGKIEKKIKKKARKKWGYRRMQLREHMSAAAVRAYVGEEFWNKSYKFCVERNPWDRLVSLWRFEQKKHNFEISLDQFLSAMESADIKELKKARAYSWRNWPIYSINDEPVVDYIVRFENLQKDLEEVTLHAGIEWDGSLPHYKKTKRGEEQPLRILTEKQIERIRRLFQREVEYFGYSIPRVAC